MAQYISFQPSDYFKTLIWTGTDAARTLTGVGFQPDCTWIKNRDAAYNHVLWDAVRTGGSNKAISPNTNGAEGAPNSAAYGYLNAFTSDGYSLGEGSSNDSYVNTTGTDYVSWNWKAGTTTGIDATGADITPTGYSFNQTSGFSIIEYEGNATGGALLPHGLGVVPEFAIFKSVDDSPNWRVYHKNMDSTAPEDYALILNDTSVRDNDNTAFNDTAPTSVNMCLGSSPTTNDGSTMIAYFFAGKSGYSKFGSFIGNGNADGTFVYTGFRPAFLLIKNIETSGTYWIGYDDKRPGYNVDNGFLEMNYAGTEGTTKDIILASNGFKPVLSINDTNQSGKTFIYAAFSKFPLVSSNDVPGVAR